jgi:hypothetical protein
MNVGWAQRKEAVTSGTTAIAPLDGRDTSAESGAAIAAAWEGLEGHFEYHAALVARFKDACRASVRRMWESGTNEVGERLTPFERDALVERYCELFGIWPHE